MNTWIAPGVEAEIVVARWRTGHKVGRTIYMMVSGVPSDDDILIGTMDSPMIASAAVNAHNSILEQMGLYRE